MLKILVIGCPGSGKSTFAKKLNNIMNIPLYHLDMIWHKDDKTTVLEEEFDLALEDILKENKWIIDGNYQRTLEKRLAVCDTVFLLDYDIDVCIKGAEARIGMVRDDLPSG